jgi:phosphoribosylglycinamide formyltransferase-1
MNDKLSVLILISGRGSNMQAILDACKDDRFPAYVCAVISNVDGAGGLEKAEAQGVPVHTVASKGFADKSEFEEALLDVVRDYQPDLICLAGFMRILSEGFIRQWPDKILNIHPSLLPDYKGLDVYRRVLADKKSESGCSVHYVVPDVDAGPVLVQKRVPIQPDDTEDTLALRILAQEHVAYPEAIEHVAKQILDKG